MDLEQIKAKIDKIKNTKDIENIEQILCYDDLGTNILEVLNAVKKLTIPVVVVPKGTLFCGKENKNCQYLKNNNKCGLRKKWCAFQTK